MDHMQLTPYVQMHEVTEYRIQCTLAKIYEARRPNPIDLMDVIGEHYAAHDTRLQHARQYLVKTTNINIRQTPKAGQGYIRDKENAFAGYE